MGSMRLGGHADLEAGLASASSATFCLNGRRVEAQITKSGITLTSAPARSAMSPLQKLRPLQKTCMVSVHLNPSGAVKWKPARS